MFDFIIEKVNYLSAAKIWCLTGKLLSGEIRNGATAFYETEYGAKKFKIEIVAFVDSFKPKNNKRLTLTVKSGENFPANLEGVRLLSTVPDSAVRV